MFRLFGKDLRRRSVVLLVSAQTLVLAQAQVTNWVAFNDHFPGSGTAPNVSGYDMWQGAGGPLTNFTTTAAYAAGQELTAIVSAAPVGGVAVQAAMSTPDPGTPAGLLFNSVIDWTATASAGYIFNANVSYDMGVTLAFTGLNPDKGYKLRITSARGRETDPPNRWTVCSLLGTRYSTDASTAGVLTPAKVPGSLTNGQAAYNSGRNLAAGDVVGWDDITPAADGSFSVFSSQYHGENPGSANLYADGFYAYGPTAFMLVEVEPSALAFTAQLPATTAVETFHPLVLSVQISGGPATFQWYLNDVAIDGATQPTYTVESAQALDAGPYKVVVANGAGSINSTTQVTVSPDNTPPTVVSAGQARNDYNTVKVVFSEKLDPLTVNEFNFFVSPTGGASLMVAAATLQSDGLTAFVSLDGSTPLQPETNYTVTISGVTDLAGKAVAANTSATFKAWPLTPGFVRFDYFGGLSAINPVDVSELLNDPRFPNNPYRTFWAGGVDSRPVFPDDSHEGYGARLTGFFTPPESGNWVFYIKSDDASRLSLNANGIDPAGAAVLLEITTPCCGAFSAHTSTAQALTAGQMYYIEALLKEGTGGDYVQVAAKLDSDPANPDNLAPIPAAWVASTADPAQAGVITISQGPSNQVVTVDAVLVFTVAAANSAGQPQFYQWRANGVAIPGANGSTYATQPLTPGDDGTLLDVVVYVPGGSATTALAKITVRADAIPPTVVAVRGSSNPREIKISFSELLEPLSVDAGNFTVTDPATSTPYDVTSAVLDATGTNVILTVEPMLTPGTEYEAHVDYVSDRTGNAIVPITKTFPSWVITRGLVKYDYFSGLSTGDNNLNTTLVVDPRFPDRPTATYYLTAFDSRLIFPDDTHEGYGSRLTGYFIPPADGNYIFYIRSDDSSRLFLNPAGMDPAGKVQIVEETGCCGAFSKLPSPPQTLTAGQAYYIEALQKEGTGGDFVQVAVRLETDPAPPNSLAPIPGSLLAILADPVGASVVITQQPTSTIVVVRPQSTPNFDFTTGNGQWIVFNRPTSYPAPWAYNTETKYWNCLGSDPCGGPYVTLLQNPVLVMTNDGDLTVSFVHRYSFEGVTVNVTDATPYDGAQMQLSVNDGPFTVVPAANFTENGYTGTIGGTALLDDKQGWIDQSPGYAQTNRLTSTATLGTFVAGDKILIRFAYSQDECTRGRVPNWEITRVDFSSGIIPPIAIAQLHVGAQGTVAGGTPGTLAYQWQQDTGAGFVDLFGETSSTLFMPQYYLDNGIGDYRCVVTTPGAGTISEAVTVTPTAPVAIQLANGTATVSWTAGATDFVLEKATSLAPGAIWTAVPSSEYKFTDMSVYITTPATGTAFYRLHRP